MISLPEEVKSEMEQDITMDELEYIVMHSDNNRSPGLDGISYEFYKRSWGIIKNDFLEVLQC